ncbi:hypothetical protein [Methylophilus sp. TWE2]|uniref:phosphoribosyltransferase-like protein n=1 Tax=Methylophilus sp. TWE2 TaxID=1662285 RepID=UPI000670FD14|nr:hypothetical protein [Methylophilus sp. TWE2]AKR42001.1 hypothetical protein ACJ67_00065 [Methylophilus sp. TWE2]
MTLNELQQLVHKWDSQNLTASAIADAAYTIIYDKLDHFANNEWRQYLPAEHPSLNASYMERLAAWIGNLSDEEDQKLFLKYALHISFFSHEDFTALYRTAFDREITQWVADQIGAKLIPHGSQGFRSEVHSALNERTWFCPVTDSMDINEFYKVNHLRGIGHRPGFATLKMLALDFPVPDPLLMNNLIQYMDNPSLDPRDPLPSLERLVLLEDIVGSGSQCLEVVEWVLNNLGRPVLFVPLILCPNGATVLNSLEQRSQGRLTVRPVIELRRGDLLGGERQGESGWAITDQLENLISRFTGNFKYEDYGYRNTGCSLATFSNTPDNTIPMIHDNGRSNTWAPLFPRVLRDT